MHEPRVCHTECLSLPEPSFCFQPICVFVSKVCFFHISDSKIHYSFCQSLCNKEHGLFLMFDFWQLSLGELAGIGLCKWELCNKRLIWPITKFKDNWLHQEQEAVWISNKLESDTAIICVWVQLLSLERVKTPSTSTEESSPFVNQCDDLVFSLLFK